MKNNYDQSLNKYLQSLEGMQQAESNPFLFTRLKARMEKNLAHREWNLPVKPVWVISTLAFLLVVNGFMLVNKFKTKNTSGVPVSEIQELAASYNQAITSTY